jgi:hypothetical protein
MKNPGTAAIIYVVAMEMHPPTQIDFFHMSKKNGIETI